MKKIQTGIFLFSHEEGNQKMVPEPKVINVDQGEKAYCRLLGGPPESVTMRSGQVVLQPGESVGKHSTECYEELVIILEGEGLFLLNEGKQLAFNADSVLYCPPNTQHNIKNTGSTPLRYIYVVAKIA